MLNRRGGGADSLSFDDPQRVDESARGGKKIETNLFAFKSKRAKKKKQDEDED